MKLLAAVALAVLLAWQQQAAHAASRARVALSHRIVETALRYRGVPYVWGGTSPRGFDCSGLIQYVFRSVGISLPRTTWSQMRVGRPVYRLAWAAPGDVVFTYDGEHEGLYLGDGLMLDANHTGSVVGIRPLAWYPGFTATRRFW